MDQKYRDCSCYIKEPFPLLETFNSEPLSSDDKNYNSDIDISLAVIPVIMKVLDISSGSSKDCMPGLVSGKMSITLIHSL